jgi:hypothetical protein
LKLRQLRFGTLGTDNTIEEAERVIVSLIQIRQERLKKFGNSNLEEDKETLDKRRQKFANSSNPAP